MSERTPSREKPGLDIRIIEVPATGSGKTTDDPRRPKYARETAGVYKCRVLEDRGDTFLVEIHADRKSVDEIAAKIDVRAV